MIHPRSDFVLGFGFGFILMSIISVVLYFIQPPSIDHMSCACVDGKPVFEQFDEHGHRVGEKL